ncbi:Uncharacterised protein [Enterobacter hormaechei]|nr:Uncharacterised protein [Enterobacter hormaechei]SAC00254.1 Uncharacterised protein [Enterobacter hormaechei]SAH81777.1 Uncharacterised protein [Enterobacter hormaechei]
MPVHQLNRLACQRALYVRNKIIEIQNVLRAWLTEENTALFAVCQIVKKTLAGKAHILTGNYFPRHHPLGVADAFCNLSH